MLPIENSSAGIVSENYDLLVEYDNYIVGEQIIRIDHSLMGLPGAKISDIRTVYSHPQALMQCSDFFDEHKDINQVAVRNTAFSAKKVKDDGSAESCDAETANITAMRQWMKEHNKDFYSIYYIDGTNYEVVEE